jgi:hypothetical protein
MYGLLVRLLTAGLDEVRDAGADQKIALYAH